MGGAAAGGMPSDELSERHGSLELLESVHSLLSSIEDFRMSEVVHEPEKHPPLSGTAAVLHNAQHLVAVIELWHQRDDGPAHEILEDIVEAVFNALHRWLSWKSASQLQHRGRWVSSETTIPAAVLADPWSESDDIAAEDLLDWLADAMPYPPSFTDAQSPQEPRGKHRPEHVPQEGDRSTCSGRTTTAPSVGCSSTPSASSSSNAGSVDASPVVPEEGADLLDDPSKPSAAASLLGAAVGGSVPTRMNSSLCKELDIIWQSHTPAAQASSRQDGLQSGEISLHRLLEVEDLGFDEGDLLGQMDSRMLAGAAASVAMPCKCLTCMLNLTAHSSDVSAGLPPHVPPEMHLYH